MHKVPVLAVSGACCASHAECASGLVSLLAGWGAQCHLVGNVRVSTVASTHNGALRLSNPEGATLKHCNNADQAVQLGRPVQASIQGPYLAEITWPHTTQGLQWEPIWPNAVLAMLIHSNS